MNSFDYGEFTSYRNVAPTHHPRLFFPSRSTEKPPGTLQKLRQKLFARQKNIKSADFWTPHRTSTELTTPKLIAKEHYKSCSKGKNVEYPGLYEKKHIYQMDRKIRYIDMKRFFYNIPSVLPQSRIIFEPPSGMLVVQSISFPALTTFR